MEPKQKQYPVVDVTGDRSKIRCCKEQHCIGTWNVRSMNQGKLEVVKQEMARMNTDNLGISELKWTGMGEFNSDDHYIYYCGQESIRRNGVAIIVNKNKTRSCLWLRSWAAIAKFRLKLKKVGKTTRPFTYDLNQILYNYTLEVTNRFKGLSDRPSAWRTMDGGSWYCIRGSDQDHPQEKERQNSCLRRPFK